MSETKRDSDLEFDNIFVGVSMNNGYIRIHYKYSWLWSRDENKLEVDVD
jgi:hypothetical protein